MIGEHAQTLLDGCRGFLHADGYAGFAKLYVPAELAPLTEIGCPPRPAGRVPSRDRIDGLLAFDGVGPVTALALSVLTPPPETFKCGRDLASAGAIWQVRARSGGLDRLDAAAAFERWGQPAGEDFEDGPA